MPSLVEAMAFLGDGKRGNVAGKYSLRYGIQKVWRRQSPIFKELKHEIISLWEVKGGRFAVLVCDIHVRCVMCDIVCYMGGEF